jgi:hypothetical protein
VRVQSLFHARLSYVVGGGIANRADKAMRSAEDQDADVTGVRCASALDMSYTPSSASNISVPRTVVRFISGEVGLGVLA